ncbi:hypothetical protein DSO57_1004709 [Entomophthora muscae]|uniref:Uncharacterized protein n=1 Tax=Entomophthora muscae TaxID=34485 RepID=A0ACC2SX77_9FUNG|nr:hypothetical protein DSO57_1004709 [Entomophthora muscae]
MAGDFTAWTDRLQDTFPPRNKPHNKGATMLHFMAQKELIFALDNKEDGLASLTQWAYDIDDTSIKGS